jgi:endonuclease/exonuclease/phosphatase family metal-dependent hydrolase
VLADVHVKPEWYPRVAPVDLEPAIRRPRLLAGLRALEADVIALQEVQPDLLPALAQAFPTHTLWHAPYSGEGLALLVRGGGATVEVLPALARQILFATLPGGHSLAVLHVPWTGEPRAGETRAGEPRSGEPQAGESRRGMPMIELALALRPDLLCGDLNALPGWPEREVIAAAGLLDGGPAGPTCNINHWLQAVDAVYHRPGWRCDAMPLPTITADTPMPSSVHPSDHLPVRVELVAPRGAPA